MPNRIIKESITTSQSIASLSWQAEVFFYRLIVNCDDYGRMDGRLPILLAKCFPLVLDKVKEKDIHKWLCELVANDFLFIYKNGHEYIQIKAWESHQQIRAHKSKFPAYDSSCHQLISDAFKCYRNPIQSESNPNTNPPSSYDYFSDFYKEYPRKKARDDAERAFKKLKMDDALMEKIMAALYKEIDSEEWKEDMKLNRGKHIPYPATWLNGRRWEDGH